MRIICPKCRRLGEIESDQAGSLSNDNEEMVSWRPPEGFRKVQLGWNADSIRLFCVDCGVASQRPVQIVPDS
ncbi:hypothetical protein FHY04_001981 [Sphingomonas sp. BK481]|jgi:hypothetical protein|nr:hypothetical protein [Sphingomonas sp. BK481]